MVERFFIELWRIMLDLSPSLLLGLVVAGVLHVFLPKNLIRRQLNGKNWKSVVRAVLVGVPMPLCSCGVVPTAIGLKNEGASKGAATGFLISTPQTGVDSILVSASFLGWPFALFKVGAAFVTGVVGGLLANVVSKNDPEEPVFLPMVQVPTEEKPSNRLLAVFDYAIFDLLAMLDGWIVIGVLAAAAISVAAPEGFFFQQEWTQGIGGMLLMLLISLPLYVCSTGSVPIAASLIAAGMPLGTALVFLMAGPASNLATLGAVYRGFGARLLAVYLGVVAVFSIGFGLAFDFVLGTGTAHAAHMHQETGWLSVLSAVVLLILLAFLLGRRVVGKFAASPGKVEDMDLVLNVKGMSCPHCVANVKKVLESFEEVKEASPDLETGQVSIAGDNLDSDKLAAAIRQAGYSVV